MACTLRSPVETEAASQLLQGCLHMVCIYIGNLSADELRMDGQFGASTSQTCLVLPRKSIWLMLPCMLSPVARQVTWKGPPWSM